LRQFNTRKTKAACRAQPTQLGRGKDFLGHIGSNPVSPKIIITDDRKSKRSNVKFTKQQKDGQVKVMGRVVC